jgi:hypothetical protein
MKKPMHKAWHEKHKMPTGATLAERVKWHVAHQKNCGCRPIPKTLLAVVKAKGQKICTRGHIYSGPGTCPICWPGGKEK